MELHFRESCLKRALNLSLYIHRESEIHINTELSLSSTEVEKGSFLLLEKFEEQPEKLIHKGNGNRTFHDFIVSLLTCQHIDECLCQVKESPWALVAKCQQHLADLICSNSSKIWPAIWFETNWVIVSGFAWIELSVFGFGVYPFSYSTLLSCFLHSQGDDDSPAACILLQVVCNWLKSKVSVTLSLALWGYAALLPWGSPCYISLHSSPEWSRHLKVTEMRERNSLSCAAPIC